jgi:hypothetical protein
MFVQYGASGRNGDAARMANNQIYPQLFLKLPDLRAQRRLSQVERVRGSSDVAGIDDLLEIYQLSKVNCALPSFPQRNLLR